MGGSMFLAQTAGQMLGLLLDIRRMGWELGIGLGWVPLPTSRWMVIFGVAGCWAVSGSCVTYLSLLWSQVGAFADSAGVPEGGESEWFFQRPLDLRAGLLFLVLSSILTRNRQTGVLFSSAGQRGSELKSHYKITAEAAGSLVDDHSQQPAHAAKMLLAVTWASVVVLGRLLVSGQPGSTTQEPVTFTPFRLLNSLELLLLHDWRGQPLRDTAEPFDLGSA